jgi:UTP-glucose-1-phosphate uridylyltransferase
MDDLTIIIPAGGQATRFNGIIKELLPIDLEGTTALLNILRLAQKVGANEIRLISNELKKAIHTHYIRTIAYRQIPSPISVHITKDYDKDLWSGIRKYLHKIQRGGLLLPDTITDFFVPEQTKGITFGVFDTHEPERFSIIENDRILTKPKNKPAGYYKAWGVVLWSAEATQYMLKETYDSKTYDEAFQSVMDTFGYSTFPLHYYYDIGTMETYMQYILDYAAHTKLVIC